MVKAKMPEMGLHSFAGNVQCAGKRMVPYVFAESWGDARDGTGLCDECKAAGHCINKGAAAAPPAAKTETPDKSGTGKGAKP